MDDRVTLIVAIGDCLEQLTGSAVDLRTIPERCPLVDLDRHGLSLDSIQLLELVVLLEERVGRDLDVAEVSDDWSTYTWGQLLDDLAAALDNRL